MSTALQTLANYYESVIQCERIYSDYIIAQQSIDPKTKQQHESILTKETISLKKQVEQLITESVSQRQEIDRLRNLNKTQRSLLESKLEAAKKRLARSKEGVVNQDEQVLQKQEDLNGRGGNEATGGGSGSGSDGSASNNGAGFHLLSPLRSPGGKVKARKLNGIAVHNRVARLRQVINEGRKTMFDEDTDDSANLTDEVMFMETFKRTDAAGNSSAGDGQGNTAGNEVHPEDEDDDENMEGEGSSQLKKRKLSRKRIQTTENEGYHVRGFRSKNLKGIFKVK
ncbi:Lrs4p Ecym_4088 [Eremothecium cymbalariae DBVPG|uniref:Uncharacterized protein n=1 Tax=Eremothecium cymbalariae (strain CBS 270.75 / DBVPG 7215 / KCTC 17166 / NRRL Y-17582) TaxID=931890 RepID=G8JT14_ERECY|nr:hypothetical protein Ecym_4088 [Eremothecium cymbalariae DBVPG\